MIAEIEEKIAAIEEKIARADQDAEQATKRHHQALEDAGKYGCTKFAKDSLEFSDNLQRVIQSAGNDPELKDLLDQVKSVQKALHAVYADFGIVEENPVGKPFNPNLHEAMFELPLPHQQTGTVAHVIQNGWMIHQRVLRPARVGVVRN